jgi:hypothetical protein
MLVLSEDEPEQKTRPKEESKPRKRNYYAGFGRYDNDYTDDQQANDGDSNELGSLQDEADEAPTLAIVSSCSVHLTMRETLYAEDCLRKYRKQVLPLIGLEKRGF